MLNSFDLTVLYLTVLHIYGARIFVSRHAELWGMGVRLHAFLTSSKMNISEQSQPPAILLPAKDTSILNGWEADINNSNLEL
jgi:hypothetical protein